jgi:hypothetical protein
MGCMKSQTEMGIVRGIGPNVASGWIREELQAAMPAWRNQAHSCICARGAWNYFSARLDLQTAFGRVSLNGARATPFSVIMAVM